ncbi:Uncharacterized protein HZ326_29544 [Fusarium oxysporum f. sp. albedinis]|nr:Uncharacterized protein HZ326_29544 [Fusarium oxysporum f. sp. albedinis]
MASHIRRALYSPLRCSGMKIGGIYIWRYEIERRSKPMPDVEEIRCRPPDRYSPGTAPPDVMSPDASLVPGMGSHALVKSGIL